MQIDPKYTFWFGVWTSILVGIAGGAVKFTNMIPDAYALRVVAWAAFFAFVNNIVLTGLSGLSSSKTGVFVAPPAPTSGTPTLVK